MLGLDINGLFYLKPDYSAASPQHESYIYPILIITKGSKLCLSILLSKKTKKIS